MSAESSPSLKPASGATPAPPRSEHGAGFFSKFTVLRGAPRELWFSFIIKLVGIVAYSLMNTTFVLWLSSDLGYGDKRAGFIVALWSAVMTFFTVLVGSLTDAIGLRKAFLFGAVVCVVSRGVLTFTTVPWLALGLGMLPLALGEALGVPVLVAGIRRYSTTAQRSISFAIFYGMMNVGFLVANPLFDLVRKTFGEHGQVHLPVLGITLSTYRALFLLSFLFEFTMLPLMYFGLREGVEATDEGVVITPEKPKFPGEPLLKAAWLSTCSALKDTLRIFGGLWRQPGFHKFLAFLTLAAFVRLVDIHMYYTYPKFGIRELGEGAPIGKLWAVNALIIIILVPFVGAFSQRLSAYKMVMIGSTIAAASVFIMALPTAWFQGMANGWPGRFIAHDWLGLNGPVHPYYVMLVLYIGIFSIGQTIYSPRLYEYAAAAAPKGQEASYMSLSYLPFFLAKLLVASFSGVLLARYCPEHGPRHSNTLWLIIALTTAIAPVGLITLRRYIQVHEAGRDD